MTDHNATLEALALLQVDRVGPATARKVLAGGPALRAKLIPELSDSGWNAALTEAQRIIEHCHDLGISPIGIDNSQYPARLRMISDAPVVIYVKGSIDALSRDGIAVVGTRKVSETGARLCKMVASVVAKRGFVVVSGLALGIDAIAHETALDNNGLTVAVMAHGLDTVSPASNRKLAERLLACGGALMSEHPPGFPARPAEFVRRNRLQSGLSLGSIIVESGIEGGSMHQARFTKNQGRRLMTVLAFSEDSRRDLNEAGANELVEKLAAVPLKSTGDLIRELDLLKAVQISDPQGARLL